MYHWICTVQVFSPAANGMTWRVSYLEGDITPAPGQTRQDVFQKCFDRVIATCRLPGDSDPIPLFFSLEPMQLDT
jgi:hypothetical protein